MGGDGSDVMSRIVLNQLKGVCKGDVNIFHYQLSGGVMLASCCTSSSGTLASLD